MYPDDTRTILKDGPDLAAYAYVTGRPSGTGNVHSGRFPCKSVSTGPVFAFLAYWCCRTPVPAPIVLLKGELTFKGCLRSNSAAAKGLLVSWMSDDGKIPYLRVLLGLPSRGMSDSKGRQVRGRLCLGAAGH